MAGHTSDLVSKGEQPLGMLRIRCGDLLRLLPHVVGGLTELHGKNRRHRRRHDSSRGHERHQGAFLTGRLGADQPQQHRSGPNDEHKQRNENQAGRQNVEDLRGGHASCKHDEQDANEEHLQVFLELDDGLKLEVALVRQVDAEHRNGDQARLLPNNVSANTRPNGDPDKNHAL